MSHENCTELNVSRSDIAVQLIENDASVPIDERISELKAQIDDLEHDEQSGLITITDEELDEDVNLRFLQDFPSVIQSTVIPNSDSNANIRNKRDRELKPSKLKYNQELLLSILLASGTNRLKRLQYCVVRRLLKDRKCSFCSLGNIGMNLPSMTKFNTIIKPYMEKTILPRKELHIVSIHTEKAGAKGGCDKYESNDSVPISIVYPSEWARLDFLTPSTRNLIWGTDNDRDPSFSNIENTPIVKDRKNCLTHYKVTGKKTLESKLQTGTRLEMKIDHTSKTLNYLNGCGFDVVDVDDVDGRKEITVISEILKVSYASTPVQRKKEYKDENKTHKHIDKLSVGDILLDLKTENAVDAVLIFRHLMDCNLEAKRISLTICHKKKDSKCSRRTIDVISIVGLDTNNTEDKQNTNQGRLKDGRRYFVYRFILYSDGFNAYQSKTGSMDGIYIIVLGIPTSKRNSSTCIRKLSLCPPGTNAKDIMKFITEDIIKGTTTGITIDVDSEQVVLFLDPVAYIADTPALSSMTGTKGHNSNIPCHLCILVKGNMVETTGKFLNSRFIDSRNPSLKRSSRRIDDIIRSSKLTLKEICEVQGVNDVESCLCQLRKSLCVVQDNIPLALDGSKVLTGLFDEYRSSLISPDHVFLGLSSCVLQLLIQSFNNQQRDLLEAYIISYLKSGNIAFNTSIMKSTRTETATLTISEIYSIAYILPYAARSVLNRSNRRQLSEEQKRKRNKK